MSLGTLTDIVIALAAVAALVLSIYNSVMQRRDARKQDERWQQENRKQDERWQQENRKQDERWQQEKLPNWEVHSDYRAGSRFGLNIYSLRIVNTGGVPVEIRSFRMVLPNDHRLPLPDADEQVKENKWDTEIPVGEGLPYVLLPGQSVRFATNQQEMEATLRRAGFGGSGFFRYEVEVEDALGNTHRVEESALLGEPHPEP